MFFESELGRMLKLLELNVHLANDIDGFHKTFHSLPHIGNWCFDLVLERGREGDLMIAQNLANFLISGWMLLQLELVHATIVRVGLAQGREKLADYGRLWAYFELIRDCIKESCMLIDNSNDVIEVF